MATWGAREDLGLITDDALESFRLSINPFRKATKITGRIFRRHHRNWVRLDSPERIATDRVLAYDESNETVAWPAALEPNAMDVTVNRINAVYLRVPLLASVHLFRTGGRGLHAEGGLVAGYLTPWQIQPRISSWDNGYGYRRRLSLYRTDSAQRTHRRRFWKSEFAWVKRRLAAVF